MSKHAFLGGTPMIAQDTVLVQRIRLIDRIPTPPPPTTRRSPGRPIVYSDRLFLKALLIMIVRRLHKVGELLAVLEEPAPEMRLVHGLLSEEGPFPSRRTFERRQFGSLRRHLVELDSTVLRAKGGVWHKKDREAGVVPHTSIDTEAHWTKSGWHGWVYGWKLHLVTTVAGVWIPLAAELTAANAADSEVAPSLLCRM